MVKEYILTTKDNPWDYFTQFDEWWNFDVKEKGYNCCGKVAKLAKTSDDLPDLINVMITNDAIDSIIRNDFFGIYKKVSREDSKE